MERGVVLILDADAGLARVVADVDRKAQVIGDLVANALRHIPAGGEISLTAKAVGAAVELAVSDTGEGIAPEHLPHVFERFCRADTARDRAHGGSGIGLAIAKALVEAHGGSIRAESYGIGRGARFVVAMPVSGTRGGV